VTYKQQKDLRRINSLLNFRTPLPSSLDARIRPERDAIGPLEYFQVLSEFVEHSEVVMAVGNKALDLPRLLHGIRSSAAHGKADIDPR
jgi:hypothetical protein